MPAPHPPAFAAALCDGKNPRPAAPARATFFTFPA